MKILLINKFFYLKGGSERVFFQERDFLFSQGFKIVDFSMDNPGNQFSDYAQHFVKGVDYHDSANIVCKLSQGVKSIHSAEAVRKIKKLLQEERPDIAHLHNIYHQLTPSILHVLRKKGVKTVLTLHDGKLVCPAYTMLDKGNPCLACDGKYFYLPVIRNCQESIAQGCLIMIEALWHKMFRSYENVDRFIAPSRFMADLISHRISKEKISILPNGVCHNSGISSGEDRNYGLYFGRLSGEKGIETLLRSHAATKNHFSLKIAGVGPLEEQLRSKYPAVEFLGHLSQKNLKPVIQRSSFVIVPSECYENCSMTILEAMAFGKPVIGSRIGGIPEQIEDKKSGLLFEPGSVDDLKDKLEILEQNVEYRHFLGRNARQKLVREFSFEKHGFGLLKIYDHLLAAS